MARNRTADMLTIACKLPQGLRIPLEGQPDVVLNGVHSAFSIAGHGMTDVKAETWAAIEKRYAEAAWLKNELVFAMGDKDSAVDKAEERQDVKTGFEAVDPKKPGPGLTKAE